MSTQTPIAKNPFLFSNPFASPFAAEAKAEVPEDAAEGTYEYALVANAPKMSAEECETEAEAIEILVRFGASVLAVAHLTPPRSYWIGESNDLATCDCEAPAELLGAQRMPIVLVSNGEIALAIPEKATGTFANASGERTIAEVRASAASSSEANGAKVVALGAGARAKMTIGALSIEVSATKAGKRVAAATPIDARALPFHGASLLVHAAILGACAVFMPALGATDEDGITQDQVYQLQAMLNDASAIREQPPSDTQENADQAKDAQGGTGTAAMGESGKMGGESKNKDGRYAVYGSRDNTDPHIASSRAEIMRDAETFGMIALVSGAANQPIAPWGRTEAWGNDPVSANGNMWGSEIGDASGFGGLGLSGVGEGGNGHGEGIGLGTIGTIGNGSGSGIGQGFGDGIGRSFAHVAGVHKTSTPRVRIGTSEVSGHLPPEVIQRVVRQNFGRFRLCYENGLRGNPNLQGRVAVRFVIGRDGAVSNVANGASDMPDNGVVSCVVRSFYGLSFPAPQDGIVTVSYPISFTPAGS